MTQYERLKNLFGKTIADRAVALTKHSFNKRAWHDTIKSSDHCMLGGAFTWDQTSEGWKFWNHIHKTINRLAGR